MKELLLQFVKWQESEEYHKLLMPRFKHKLIEDTPFLNDEEMIDLFLTKIL